MFDIAAYVNRAPCKKCYVNEEGVLNHCENCNELFQKAKLYLVRNPPRLSIHEVGVMKKTHKWIASRGYNLTRTSMTPFTSHCSKCGVTIFAFKAKPIQCPKNDE